MTSGGARKDRIYDNDSVLMELTAYKTKVRICMADKTSRSQLRRRVREELSKSYMLGCVNQGLHGAKLYFDSSLALSELSLLLSCKIREKYTRNKDISWIEERAYQSTTTHIDFL
jgi:hypothetical protein